MKDRLPTLRAVLAPIDRPLAGTSSSLTKSKPDWPVLDADTVCQSPRVILELLKMYDGPRWKEKYNETTSLTTSLGISIPQIFVYMINISKN